MNKLVLVFILVFFKIASFAAEVDYLALSEMLLKDGSYKRAKVTLDKAFEDLEDAEKFYLLYGLYLLRVNKADDAIENLKSVTRSSLQLQKFSYLAESYLELNKPIEALRSIHKISDFNKAPLSVIKLKAKVEYECGHYGELHNTLKLITDKNYRSGKKVTIHYFLKLGLYQEALKESFKLFSKSDTSNDVTQISQLLIGKDRYSEAMSILEYGAAKYDTNTDILKMLASIYHQKGMKFISGDMYTKLAYIDQQYSGLAAEYLSQNHRTVQSSLVNISIDKPIDKLSQKLRNYLANDRYDLARSLAGPLKQYGAYEKDEIKYAMAYTYLMQGEYGKSTQLLNKIKNTHLINKSLKLMALVDDCKKSGWECYGSL